MLQPVRVLGLQDRQRTRTLGGNDEIGVRLERHDVAPLPPSRRPHGLRLAPSLERPAWITLRGFHDTHDFSLRWTAG